MTLAFARLLTATAWPLRLAVAVLVCIGFGAAQAATYAYRTDTYSWETTTNTIAAWDGTCTDFPGDDDQVTITFTGGFTFPFAGTSYSSVRVLSNGMLQLGSDTGFQREFDNTALPAASATSYGGCTAAATARIIMPLWLDLDPSNGGTVTWQQKGSAPNRYLVVSWNGVPRFNTSSGATFQVILYENGEFKYQYGSVPANRGTVGVQVSSSDYTQYSYNSTVASSLALRWYNATTATQLARWRFNETSWSGSSGEATESAAYQFGPYNGTALNGAVTSNTSPRAVEGSPGSCRYGVFSGAATQQGVDMGAVDLGLGGVSAMSVGAWVRWTVTPSTGNSGATIVANNSAITQDVGQFWLEHSSSNTHFQFAVRTTTGRTTVTSTTAPAANTWYHVTGVYTGSALQIYVNGVLEKSVVLSGSLAAYSSAYQLMVGRQAYSLTNYRALQGNVDEVNIYRGALSAAQIATLMADTSACPTATLDHVEIHHGTGSGLTCSPVTLTVAACQDAACSTGYTGGLTGNITAAGSTAAAFSIASGSSTVSVNLQRTTVGSVLLGTSGLSTSASNATTCNFGSPSCTFTFADSGLLFDVPNHASETAQTVSVSAVKKSDNSLACVPAFASVTKSVTFKCSYSNPSSGTLPVRVGGRALNSGNSSASACDGTGQSVSLSFDASGTASTTVQYADVGQMTLAGTYTGSGSDAGLVMSGSDSFIAAPASFAFSSLPASKVAAGSAFSATVTARNSSGTATPNFGKESVPASPTLGFTRRTPTGTNANGVAVSDGSFTGSLGAFSGGAATASNLIWTEVGKGDLSATLSSYLGSGLSATGTTGSAGAVQVIPHHFDVVVTTPGCGSFTYAGGQTFTATATAKNAAGTTTANYDGSFGSPVSQSLSFGEASSLGGSLSSGPHAAAASFRLGVGTGTPSYSFGTKQTAEKTLLLSATDTDGVTSTGSPQSGNSTTLRSGRLRVTNGFGSEKASLQLSVLAQYWSGNAWVLNSADSCTNVPAAAVALSNYRNYQGGTGSWTTSASSIAISAGNGTLTLAAPSGNSTGSVDVALNLGTGAGSDQSCLGNHPATTGAGLAWLRSRNGSCATTWDRDPSAQAAFGIYSPETKKTVHVREIF